MSGDDQNPDTTGSEEDDDEVFDGAKLPHTEINSSSDPENQKPSHPPPPPTLKNFRRANSSRRARNQLSLGFSGTGGEGDCSQPRDQRLP